MMRFYFLLEPPVIGHVQVTAPDILKAMEWITHFYPQWTSCLSSRKDLSGLEILVRDRLEWKSRADLERWVLTALGHP